MDRSDRRSGDLNLLGRLFVPNEALCPPRVYTMSTSVGYHRRWHRHDVTPDGDDSLLTITEIVTVKYDTDDDAKCSVDRTIYYRYSTMSSMYTKIPYISNHIRWMDAISVRIREYYHRQRIYSWAGTSTRHRGSRRRFVTAVCPTKYLNHYHHDVIRDSDPS